jgi:hypothetical protein
MLLALEKARIRVKSDSTFLPFHSNDTRWRNFAVSTELLRLIASGADESELLQWTLDVALADYRVQTLYLIRKSESGNWAVSWSPAATGEIDFNPEFPISDTHALSQAFETGSLGISKTTGELFETVKMTNPSGTPGHDSFQLLLIPLIGNLVVQEVLVGLIPNEPIFEPADIELLSTLQVLLSNHLIEKDSALSALK